MKDMTKTTSAKIGAGILSVMMVGGTVFGSSLYQAPSLAATKDATAKSETQKAVEETYKNVLQSNGSAKDKTETTFVIMDADGNVKQSIVEEKLANGNKDASLADTSNLKDIENTSGNEKFTKNGNDLTWDAKGNQIKYKGEATSELPIDVHVTYFLDGKEMSAKDIAGRAGNVKIKFTYDVKQIDNVDGMSVVHPYTMASGVMLDDQHFSDVEVSNGKAIDDGSKTVALGIAFPGMNQNLGLDPSTIDLPEEVVISAHTDDFEFAGTYSVALSGILNDIDTSGADSVEGKVDELKNGLNQLSDASKQLVEGSDQLASGATEAASGASQLKDGANKLDAGAGELKDGTSQLKDGSAKLEAGSEQLQAGTDKLKAGTSAMNSKMPELSQGSTDLTNGANALNEKMSAVSQGSTNLKNGVNEMISSIGTMKTNMTELLKGVGGDLYTANNYVNTSVEKDKAASDKLDEMINSEKYDADTIADLESIKKNVDESIAAATSTNGSTSTALEAAGIRIENYKKAASQSESTQQKKLSALQTGAANLDAGINGYVDQSGTYQPGVTKAVEQIASGSNTLNAGINGYVDPTTHKPVAGVVQGIAGLDAGADLLKAGIDGDGTEQNPGLVKGMQGLNAGIVTADNGVGTLKAGTASLAGFMGQLVNGANKLADGANQLKDGMNKFNNEGVQKFVDSLSESDLMNVGNRLKATADASRNEVFVGGKLSTMSGESKMIFKTGEVAK